MKLHFYEVLRGGEYEMLINILVYLFFGIGTLSFLGELVWRITHWKDKDVTKNCNISVDANSRISTEELVKKLDSTLKSNLFKM
jgi:hypothetical protein